MNLSLQRNYFNQVHNQFPADRLITPLYSQQLEMEHLFRILNPLPGSTILDFGSGSGRISIYFLSQGYDVTAYDISTKSLANLRKTYSKHKTSKWGKLRTITKLDLQPRVDMVVGADVLHHISLGLELPVIYKILKSGGRICFSEPNPYNLFWYVHYLVSHVPWSVESGILNCSKMNISRKLRLFCFSDISFSPHGLLPTRLFNFSKILCRLNAYYIPAIVPFSFFFLP